MRHFFFFFQRKKREFSYDIQKKKALSNFLQIFFLIFFFFIFSPLILCIFNIIFIIYAFSFSNFNFCYNLVPVWYFVKHSVTVTAMISLIGLNRCSLSFDYQKGKKKRFYMAKLTHLTK